jgi:hypothetical protein
MPNLTVFTALFSYFLILSNDQLHLETEYNILLINIHLLLRPVLQNSHDGLFRRSFQNMRKHLMMTLNRYLLVGKDHPPWLVTLAKLEFKWVIRGSILFRALINIGHGWQYQAINYLLGYVYAGGDEFYKMMNGQSYSDYPQANQGTA